MVKGTGQGKGGQLSELLGLKGCWSNTSQGRELERPEVMGRHIVRCMELRFCKGCSLGAVPMWGQVFLFH